MTRPRAALSHGPPPSTRIQAHCWPAGSCVAPTPAGMTSAQLSGSCVRFLLIDRIIELVPGERILASSVVPTDLELFQDHFPGFPVMPGVLLTEMMGQAAAKCLDAQRLPRGKALLAKIQSAAFRDWVRPGDEATLRANIVTNHALYASAECHLEVSARNVAEAKLMFTFMPIEKFAPGFSDRQLDEFLGPGKP